ncbi:Complement C1q tumor necrosis factor-related protein 3 [Mactra antiquata]
MAVFLCLFFAIIHGALSEENVSMDSITKRLEYLENKVMEQEKENSYLRSEVTKCQMNNDNTRNLVDTQLSKRFIMDTQEGVIAFTAAISPKVVDHVKDNDIIKFDTTITDVGGGYNNITGVFVAPLSGIYSFSCSLLDHSGIHQGPDGAMIHAEIIHNQRLLGRIFAHASTTYRDQGAQTVVAVVKQGDQVFVRSVDNQDLGLGGEFYSTFTGHLLQFLDK